ncbi:MAG TPA: outer membrane protein transport protein [Gemmatimonadales bacterium]|jgi:long-chain fatty acid transport protein|nr:outer membrane protein transport protein [Gemmatimonadales bacterium]
MRRFALVLLAGACALVAALPRPLAGQGFGVYEHNSCAMGRAGVAAARPCADGSAIFFSPAGLAGMSGTHLSFGATLIGAQGGFTDDFLAERSDLKNPLIPVPNVYFTRALSPKVTAGIGLYAPYGLQTKWDPNTSAGRFVGYFTDVRSIYIQPTIGYQVSPKLRLGFGVAYITSHLQLKQRADLSTQLVPDALRIPAGLPVGTTFGSLGVATGTDFADAHLKASGTGFAVNFGAIWQVNDRLSIGGHWLTRKRIDYDGDATFAQVLTGLVLPVAVGPLPAGTPVDAVLAPQFGSGAPLSNGGVSTSIMMPPQGSLGFDYKLNDAWSVMADYQYVVWGWFNKVDIDFANPATPDLPLHPGNKDTHGFRFGTEYQYNTKVQLRGGYLYHTGASPAQFVTPLLPEGARNEFTIGAGVELSPHLRTDLAYQYIKQNDRRGTVNLAAGNTGLYQFSAHLFGLGLALTF